MWKEELAYYRFEEIDSNLYLTVNMNEIIQVKV